MSWIRRFSLARLGAGVVLAGMVGCASMPNSSNPTLAIDRARMANGAVALEMTVDNPSDYDLQLEDIHWSLVYGPLPVSEGSWTVGRALPSKGSLTLTQRIPFDTPPLDPSASEIELTGEMKLRDPSNSGNRALERASFRATGKVREPAP